MRLQGALAGHVSRLLYVKLFRDIREHGWQFLAVIVVVLLGVTLYGGSYDSYQNLKASYDGVHSEFRYADLTFEGGPWAAEIADRVRAQPGVAFAEARVVVDPPIRVANTKKLVGRVVGIPRFGQPSVNRLSIVSGRWPATGDDLWVFVEKHFAEAHGLKVGGGLEILGTAGWQRYRIEGIAISPEYIWPARSRQDVFPSPENFGVVFAPSSATGRVAGLGRRANDVVIHMEPGASEQGVRARVTSVLGAERVDEVTPQREQPSDEALRLDLEQFQQLAGFFPALFLSIGAISIYVMLTRLVHQQRPQVGLLRASGYSTGTVVRHYLMFGVVVGIVGGVPGAALGVALSDFYTRFYVGFLTIPLVVVRVYPETLAIGFSMSLAACLLAAWAPACTASKIRPADAMRGETPTGGGRVSVFERVVPPLRRFSALAKIPLRSIGRSRRRALYTILGVVFANVLILVSVGMLDTVEYWIDDQFFITQKQDIQVVFRTPLPAHEAVRLSRVRGVTAAEPVVEVPVTLYSKGEKYSTALIAFMPGTRMHEFKDEADHPLRLGGEGMLLGRSLRDRLRLEPGDRVRVEIAELEAEWEAPVAGFVKEGMGSFAYADARATSPRLARAVRFAPELEDVPLALRPQLSDTVVTSVYLQVTEGERAAVIERLREKDSIAAVQDARAVYDMLQDYMGLTYAFMGVMLTFGGVMAFAVIFNTMSVNVFERTREIVTLRTLGIRQRQISHLITAENMLLAACGIVPGLIAGRLFAGWAFAMMQTSDLVSFDLYIYPRSYIVTAATIQGTALLAQFPALRAVHRVDATRVIKERSS